VLRPTFPNECPHRGLAVALYLIAAAVLVILAAAAAAQAQSARDLVPRAVHARADDVVRVQSGDSLGSGCYLGDRLVLTAGHVVADATAVCNFRNAGQHRGRFVAVDRDWDQALIELDTLPPHTAGAPLAQDNPKPGDLLVAAGYSSGSLLFRPGRCLGYSTNQAGQPLDWLRMSNAVQPGDSGGPLFNAAGEVVGNVWGSDYLQANATSTGLTCGRTWLFLAKWRARLQAWRQRTQCGPWGCQPRQPGYPWSPSGPTEPPRNRTPIQKPDPPRQFEIDYEKLAAALAKHLPTPRDGVDGKPGPPGKDGTDGRDGIDGAPGPPGRDAVLPDPLFIIRKIDGPSGEIVEEIPIRAGGSFDFLMYPSR